MGNRSQGFQHKYNVERADGKAIGPCLVMEFDDPNSWPAIAAWAETVDQDGYKVLAKDIRYMLDYHRAKIDKEKRNE